MIRDSDLLHFFEDGAKIKLPSEISQPLFVYLLAANSDGQTCLDNFGLVWTILSKIGPYPKIFKHRWLWTLETFIKKSVRDFVCSVQWNTGNWTYWNFLFQLNLYQTDPLFQYLSHHLTCHCLLNYGFFPVFDSSCMLWS